MAYFASATDVLERMSERGFQLRLDDRPEAIAQVLREATNRVKAYAMPLYTLAVLQADADAGGFTNDIATTLAVCILARRRGNSIAAPWKEQCEQAQDELEMIRRGNLQIPDAELLSIGSPAFSNVRVMPGYIYKKVRVEWAISEQRPVTGYTQAFDWRSFSFVEY